MVSSAEKDGRDAGDLADLGRRLGVTRDDGRRRRRCGTLDGGGAVAYMASGELRPDDAVTDIAALPARAAPPW